MKTINLILLTICFGLLTSCSSKNDLFGLEDLSSNSNNQTACEDSNGTISAQISGSDDYNNSCFEGTYSESNGYGVLTLANFESYTYNQNTAIIEQYLIIIAYKELNSNDNCIQTGEELPFQIFYFDHFRLDEEYENENQEGFYSADGSSDLEICFTSVNAARASGTFSGTLYNYLGESKRIQNGRFDFQF